MRKVIAFVFLLAGASSASALNCDKQRALEGAGMVPIYRGKSAGTYRVCRIGNAGDPGQSLEVYVDKKLSAVLIFTKKKQQCIEVDGSRIEVQLQGGGNLKSVSASSARCTR